MARKKSVVWSFFKTIDSHTVKCLLCGLYLRKQNKGSTCFMLRHLRAKHPREVSGKRNGRVAEPTDCNDHQDMETDGEQLCSDTASLTICSSAPAPVDVALEDKDSDTVTTVNEADVNSAINGILDALQSGPVEQTTHKEASDDRPARRTRHRSLIWRYFDRLDTLNAARCRICVKKLQCCESGSTSNLRRHMSKRHPKLFSELVANRQHPPPLNLTQESIADCETDEICRAMKREQVSAALKDSRVSEGERCVFRRERDLIEALRRTQKEEARTLEHQMELLEKLRAASAREAAAEREKIEFLRKAQQEEAKDLSRQREELQKEKAELQKKWEELQQERELLLISRGQEAS